MTKQLLLIRHGQAVEKSSYQPDKERELTQTGVHEAAAIAAQLLGKDFRFEIMHVSSAERTIQTGLIVANAMQVEKSKVIYHDELYDASTRTFFQFIANLPDTFNAVCCVGHNPAISYLAEYLTKAEIGDMTTGSCAVVRFENLKWLEVSQGNGKLVDYIIPNLSRVS